MFVVSKLTIMPPDSKHVAAIFIKKNQRQTTIEAETAFI